MMHITRRLIPAIALGAALALGALAASAAPAAAAPAVSGGFWTGSGTAEIGGVLSDEIGIPATPLNVELAIGAPLSDNGGRFAATAALVGHGSAGFIGGGLGVGQLERNGTSGLIFTGLAGTKIAGPLSVEIRLYGGGGDVGSGAFFGLRLAL